MLLKRVEDGDLLHCVGLLGTLEPWIVHPAEPHCSYAQCKELPPIGATVNLLVIFDLIVAEMLQLAMRVFTRTFLQRALFGSATRNLDIKQLDVVKRCQAHINENGGGWIKCVRVSPSPWIFNNCRFFHRDSSKVSKECTGSRADWDARFMKVFAAEIFEMRLACQIVLADYKQSKSSKKCSATISAFLKTRE